MPERMRVLSSESSADDLQRDGQQGEMAALAALYDRFAPIVYRVARAITLSADDAEDVVHDVFLAVGRRPRSYSGAGSLEGWFRRVAARAALSRLRTARRRRELRLVHAAEMEVSQRAVAGIRIELDQLLNNLPVRLRVVVVLRELEQLSHAEVADALGISVAASKVRHHRAMHALRDFATRNED